MGFIIHKYFLSKSLKAPPPSDSSSKKKNKKTNKAPRRYSQPAGGSGSGSTSMSGVAQPFAADYYHGGVPDVAYMNYNSNNNNNNNHTRRRRSSMNNAYASSSASFRRASMPAGGTVIMEESGNSSGSMMDDSSMGSLGLGLGRQKSFRRASLQNDSMYRQPSTHHEEGRSYYHNEEEEEDDDDDDDDDNEYQNSFSGYYQVEDTKEETAYADWDEASSSANHYRQRRFPRRASTGSAASSDYNNNNSDSNSMDGGSTKSGAGAGAGANTMTTTTSMMHTHPSRLRQENKWLQVQLKQMKRHCGKLESKLYGARDQLAYTNASYLDQLYDTQHKHQQEVFQSQRQAEKASNAVLEQELEDLRNTLHRVAQEEAKLEEKKKELYLVDTKSASSGTAAGGGGGGGGGGIGDNNNNNNQEEYNVKQLHAELMEWKQRHAQATLNSKRIQDILEQEAMERNALLQESERRVQWLEQELKTVIPPAHGGQWDNLDYQDTSSSPSANSRHIALLHQHQSQLEERVQELLLENAQLQRGQAQSYELQTQVKELQDALNESKKEQDLHQAWHVRQVHHWKEEVTKWQNQAQTVQDQLSHQETSREAIRNEYAHRIESLEAENFRWKHELETKQKQWTHQSNLKERTIASLKEEMNRLGDGGGTPKATATATHYVASPVAEARSHPTLMERLVEHFPEPFAKSSTSSHPPLLDPTVATEDTVFDGASSSSSIPEGPVAEKDPLRAAAAAAAAADESASSSTSSERLLQAQQREKELLLQISRLTEREANATKTSEQYKEQIQILESYLNQEEEQPRDSSFDDDDDDDEPSEEERSQDDESCAPRHKSLAAHDDPEIEDLLDSLLDS